MIGAKLRLACFWIAVLAIGASVACILFAPAQVILFPASIFVGGAALLLFLRMLFSRAFRQGLNAVSDEMHGGGPWSGKSKKFLDPDWGLFRKRAGSKALLWVRAVLLLGILPIFTMESFVEAGGIWLWMAGSFVAMELSLLHAALPLHHDQISAA